MTYKKIRNSDNTRWRHILY